MDFRKENIVEFLNIALQTVPGEGCGDQSREVNNLPKSFDSLNVEASVGIGRATSIPWVTFTGYGQKTSNGIYPVLLFYHERNLLIVAFGISVTNTPIKTWNVEGVKTLEQYFLERKLLQTKIEKKYNSSFVHSVFPIPVIGGKVDESKFSVDAVFSSLTDVCGMYKKQFEGEEIATTVSEPMPTIETSVKIVDKSKKSVNYWIYAPGDQACKWSTCQRLGHMSLGWEEMGTLSLYKDRTSIVQNLRIVYNDDQASFKNASLAIWQFVHDIKIGDIIYVKKGRSKIVGRGVVTGNYKYDETLDDYNNIRSVNWTHVGEWDAPWGLPMKTLTRLDSEQATQMETLFSEKEKIEQIPFDVNKAKDFINGTGLLYEDDFFKRYVYSLLTKPFVILSGLAGSGKTQLALAFAKAMVEDVKKQMRVVSVGADWTNREPLLGYPNALKENEYVRPESGVLDLLIEANKEANKDKPYFLILDEMNLSYVERYFADFLSAMESHHSIPLWDADVDNEELVPDCISLPKNLFIIGTINVDETTYMFSPKVLDRANVIEFKISEEEMNSFLDAAPSVNVDLVNGKCANMAEDFVKIAADKKEISKDANDVLKKFFSHLKGVNAEFGYRTASEIGRFMTLAKDDIGTEKAIDAAIVQKLLPKLHGSRKKMTEVLKALFELCKNDGVDTNIEKLDVFNSTDYKYPVSADKILRMYNIAIANGYTSFAEA